MPKMDYRDFLQDELFLYWRLHPTKELDSFWGEYLAQNKKMQGPFNEAIIAFERIRGEQGSKAFDETVLYHKLEAILHGKKRRVIGKRLFSSIAAAALLLLIVSILLFYNKSDGDDSPFPSIGQVMSNNHIQLITGENIMELEDNATVNFEKKITRATKRDNPVNKLIVPYGKRSNVILADGSRIHLNSGTKMEFPSHFTGNQREIHIEGEIFIEVTPLDNMLFLIHTPTSTITVRGTTLNVTSYAEDQSESVVLVSGMVEVNSKSSSVVLTPNEMAKIEAGAIVKSLVDVSDYTSWVDGFMQLSKVPLNEVLVKVGRYYNKEFTYDPDIDLSRETCSGKLFLSDDFTDVLDAFSKMTFLNYSTLENGEIRIEVE